MNHRALARTARVPAGLLHASQDTTTVAASSGSVSPRAVFGNNNNDNNSNSAAGWNSSRSPTTPRGNSAALSWERDVASTTTSTSTKTTMAPQQAPFVGAATVGKTASSRSARGTNEFCCDQCGSSRVSVAVDATAHYSGGGGHHRSVLLCRPCSDKAKNAPPSTASPTTATTRAKHERRLCEACVARPIAARVKLQQDFVVSLCKPCALDAPNMMETLLQVGRVFGEPLSAVVARETIELRRNHGRHVHGGNLDDRSCCTVSVPLSIGRLAVYVVRSGALADEGVFRIAGRKDHADALRVEIEQASLQSARGGGGGGGDGAKPMIVVALTANELMRRRVDPHIVTAVLKQYLRALPDPLLTAKLYQPLLAFADYYDDNGNPVENSNSGATIDAAPTTDAVLARLSDVLRRLPAPNGALLGVLLHLLDEAVGRHGARSRMSPRTAAICIAPSILTTPLGALVASPPATPRSLPPLLAPQQVEQHAAAFGLQKAARVVAAMLQNYSRLVQSGVVGDGLAILNAIVRRDGEEVEHAQIRIGSGSVTAVSNTTPVPNNNNNDASSSVTTGASQSSSNKLHSSMIINSTTLESTPTSKARTSTQAPQLPPKDAVLWIPKSANAAGDASPKASFMRQPSDQKPSRPPPVLKPSRPVPIVKPTRTPPALHSAASGSGSGMESSEQSRLAASAIDLQTTNDDDLSLSSSSNNNNNNNNTNRLAMSAIVIEVSKSTTTTTTFVEPPTNESTIVDEEDDVQPVWTPPTTPPLSPSRMTTTTTKNTDNIVRTPSPKSNTNNNNNNSITTTSSSSSSLLPPPTMHFRNNSQTRKSVFDIPPPPSVATPPPTPPPPSPSLLRRHPSLVVAGLDLATMQRRNTQMMPLLERRSYDDTERVSMLDDEVLPVANDASRISTTIITSNSNNHPEPLSLLPEDDDDNDDRGAGEDEEDDDAIVSTFAPPPALDEPSDDDERRPDDSRDNSAPQPLSNRNDSWMDYDEGSDDDLYRTAPLPPIPPAAADDL